MPVTKKVVALSSLVALSAAAIAPALAQQSLNGAGAPSLRRSIKSGSRNWPVPVVLG